MTNFSDLLNTWLSYNEQSKNKLIQQTGIDRSSFFQILKGKRLPTDTQMCSILSSLVIPEDGKSALYDAYYMDKYGEDAYIDREFVLNIFKLLKKHENPVSQPSVQYNKSSHPALSDKTLIIHNRQELADILEALLRKTTEQEGANTVRFFSPFDELFQLSFFDMLTVMSCIPQFTDINFCHIFSYPVQRKVYKKNIYLSFIRFVDFILPSKLNYKTYYYYDSLNIQSSFASLFPYYFIFSDGILFINRSYDQAYYLTDKDLIELYVSEFDKVLKQTSPMIISNKSLENLVDTYCSIPDQTNTYYLSYQPGLSFMATDKFIDKYAPESLRDLSKKHMYAFQHTNYTEITTLSGISMLKKNETFNELFFSVEPDPADVKDLFMTYLSRVGKTLLFAAPDRLNISTLYSVYVISDNSVTLVPLNDSRCSINICEENIVSAFTSFFENLPDSYYIESEENIRSALTDSRVDISAQPSGFIS